ncbi:hypothetical protein BJ322DRAFT_1064083 [Thelephora terrestris]|uniref:Tyrosine--tRNA ligase n=1 Tax=Thelephora terrestris TaxID=56493 RepID=A0A9P6L5H4_9AGAM|nr:hypothetical protein BJ322DRAFT_1064083 [Thelephora terrestris]
MRANWLRVTSFCGPRVRNMIASHMGRLHHTKSELLDELVNRGLIDRMTRPEALQHHLRTPQTIYSGVDPTSSALHVGHLIPLMVLLHFHLRGHKIIPLIGGATARIGDPSGRLSERPLLSTSSVEDNASILRSAVTKFFQGSLTYAAARLKCLDVRADVPEVLDNFQWYKSMGLLEFLRVAGYHSRVNTMLGRESVRARLDSKEGISFTEFTYQLLQAYDFQELHRSLGCTLQVGGSDQWGNILAGVDLINRIADAEQGPEARDKVYGMTTPLLTNSSGLKFSKSTGTAVWLDRTLSSYQDFYQFFIRCPDEQVEQWLKMFTLLEPEQIAELMQRHKIAPHLRVAQKVLAGETTEMVHGPSAVRDAQTAAKVLFDSDYSSINVSDLLSALESDPKLVYVDKGEIFSVPLIKMGASTTFFGSVSAAKNMVKSSGLKLNNKVVRDPFYVLKPDDLLGERVAILKAGPHRHLVLAVR